MTLAHAAVDPARRAPAPARPSWAPVAVGQWAMGFRVMGGPGEIRLAASSQAHARDAAEAALRELQRIELKYSRYRVDSIVSRINDRSGSGEWIDVDPETAVLLDYAQALHHESDGAFDITAGVYRQAWDFAQGRVPDAAQVSALQASVNAAAIERDGARVRLARAGMEIDLGGIGKEYAADRAAALMLSLGMRHGYVNLAGDLCAMGPQPDGTAWLVGIQHPRKGEELMAQIPLFHGGLATSGDYQRCIVRAGQYLHHILDARSGWPVLHWQSVSVAAPRALAAGSLCTLAMLKGPAALDYLDAQGVAYLAVDLAGQIHTRRAPAPV